MNFDRSSGVLCHLTSLPGPHGIGDLGPAAHDFLDALDAADQTHWQVLPLGPTRAAHGDSPYASPSTFAGNPLLVSLERLVERGWLDPLDPPAFPTDEVAYDRVRSFKTDALRRAHEGFEAHASEAARADLAAFREAEDWLDDYALYAALADHFDGEPWSEWPAELRERDPDALEAARDDLASEVAYHEFVQFCFDEQWTALREAAAARGIEILGDLPIYVALDSADVWADREAFLVDEDGQPEAVAGVPPNPGDDGQRWGNPLYDWDYVERTEFDWWRRRVSRLFDLVDEARLDHFKGFHEFWAIPAEGGSPAAGEWREGPGEALFAALERDHGDLPFVAEDLGFLDAGAVGLRERLGFPGMRVPHYADWCEEGHMYQPMHYPRDSVGYTSTHDTDTTVGYYESMDPEHRDCLHYNLGVDGSEVAWSMIDAVWGSNAVLAFTTPQDLLSLGSDARLNTPGTAEGNWRWRFEDGALDGVADRLARVTDRHVR
ncbi:MAG: 4-alpha-glucanotransferase [Haloferacaceae archaeon]